MHEDGAEGMANAAPAVLPCRHVALPPLVLWPNGTPRLLPVPVALRPLGCAACAHLRSLRCVGRVTFGLGAARRHRCVVGGVRLRVVVRPHVTRLHVGWLLVPTWG